MPETTAHYELVLMLDPEAPDERRDQIAAEARGRIESGGTLSADKAWGMRKLAYEIRQRTEADYRFFRFETASPVLDELDHSLKITDGVLRFRIFKVDADSPVVEPPPPVALAAGSGRPGRRGPGGSGGRPPRDDAPPPSRAEPPATAEAEEAAPGTEPEAPAEAPPEQAAAETPAEQAEEPAAEQAEEAAPEQDADAGDEQTAQ